jgi:hypothetical protein
VQLSAFADPESGTWDVAVDGRWLGGGPGDAATVAFASFDPSAFGSARLLVVWLADGDTYTFAALRPQNAKGQDKDQIAVSLPDTKSDSQVFDPRLSTEYSAAGVPKRFGVELWLGNDPEGDLHPLRLGGEAAGASPALSEGQLNVYPMRAHSAGVPGLGLYVLVQ